VHFRALHHLQIHIILFFPLRIKRILNQTQLKIILEIILKGSFELDREHEIISDLEGIIGGEYVLVVDLLVLEVDPDQQLDAHVVDQVRVKEQGK
jgi:hypothetical protein